MRWIGMLQRTRLHAADVLGPTKNTSTKLQCGTKKPTIQLVAHLATTTRMFQRTTTIQPISCGPDTTTPTPVETHGLDTDETGTMQWSWKTST